MLTFIAKSHLSHHTYHKSYGGSIMVITLIFLLLSALISSRTFFGSIIETKKTGNFQAARKAFEVSESALREAETLLSSTKERPFANTTLVTPPAEETDNTPPPIVVYTSKALEQSCTFPCKEWVKQNDNFWEKTGREIQPKADGDKLTSGRFIIEESLFVRDNLSLNDTYAVEATGVVYYRLSAKGKSEKSSRQTLQSTYSKRFN